MQTTEVKRLSINKLSEYPVISLEEQMELMGGFGWSDIKKWAGYAWDAVKSAGQGISANIYGLQNSFNDWLNTNGNFNNNRFEYYGLKIEIGGGSQNPDSVIIYHKDGSVEKRYFSN